MSIRRASTLYRTLPTFRGISSASTTAGANHRFMQVAFYASNSTGGFCHSRRVGWHPSFSFGGSARTLSIGVAGAVVSFAAGMALSQEEVYAKEMPPPELVPKEVVLYQYEACPFCNKVKGALIALLLLLLLYFC